MKITILHSTPAMAAPTAAVVARVVVPFDEAMAGAAAGRGGRIDVAAALATTLDPRLSRLPDKARTPRKTVALKPLLVGTAYRRLAAARGQFDRGVEVVVLAQDSVARELPHLPEAGRDPFLTSPSPALHGGRAALERTREVTYA